MGKKRETERGKICLYIIIIVIIIIIIINKCETD